MRWISKPGPPERLGQARLRVALAPREHLDGDRGGGERDRAAGHRARLLERPPQQHRAGQVGGEHRRDQVRAAAVVLLGGRRPRPRSPARRPRSTCARRRGRRRARRRAARTARARRTTSAAIDSPPAPRRCRRASAPVIEAPAATPITEASWNGSRAEGSARLTSGITAIASPRRTTPRTPGTPSARVQRAACARRRPRPRPCAVRTAAAQCVGPCTSSPLRSAIPPRRSFSVGSVMPAASSAARGRSSPRSRGRGRRSARRRRGSAARSRTGSGGAAGRTRRRRSRGTRRGTSASR